MFFSHTEKLKNWEFRICSALIESDWQLYPKGFEGEGIVDDTLFLLWMVKL